MKIYKKYSITNYQYDNYYLLAKRGHPNTPYWGKLSINTKIFNSEEEANTEINGDEYLLMLFENDQIKIVELDVVIDNEGYIQCLSEYGTIVRAEEGE